MTNYIHLITVPETDDGLQRVLKPLHMRYAQRINRAGGGKAIYGKGDFFHHP
jgi:putative transposase